MRPAETRGRPQRMPALLGPAALVLVAGAPWMLLAAAGGEMLGPPQHVHVYIIDDSFTLKWSWTQESVGTVAFSAEYQTSSMENWLKLRGCQHIVGTECDFSSANLDIYEEVKLRLRAEQGDSTSSWIEVEEFAPFKIARIGPPEVRLEAEDKAILIYISRPGKGGNMWAMDNFNFIYNILLWQNSSGVEKTIKTYYFTDKIFHLLPETTYCLKVKAVQIGLERHSAYSPVDCINTTVANKVPAPENVAVSADDENYILRWDYAYTNVTFKAQWLPAYLKWSAGGYSDKWRPIPTCENVRRTHCVFPRDTLPGGIHFLRVQASDGTNTSFWSEEKKLDCEEYTVIPPPVVALTSTSDSLRVSVSSPDDSMSKFYELTYEFIFWENTSNTERTAVRDNSPLTLVNLQALTVYCVKARALVIFPGNNSSDFSDTVCERTKPGNSFIIWIIAGGLATVFSVIIVYIMRNFLKCLKYVFFPSLKPPDSINEYFSEPPIKNLLLLTSEEQTEQCFIIENTDKLAVEEKNVAGEDHRRYSSQTSQDSGNFSNEEEGGGSEPSEGL